MLWLRGLTDRSRNPSQEPPLKIWPRMGLFSVSQRQVVWLTPTPITLLGSSLLPLQLMWHCLWISWWTNKLLKTFPCPFRRAIVELVVRRKSSLEIKILKQWPRCHALGASKCKMWFQNLLRTITLMNQVTTSVPESFVVLE